MAAATRELHDHYFHEAKRRGYVARSALKLTEILESRQLIKRGQRVLDLGSAPGAWLQVATQAIGPARHGGRIVGVDIKPFSPPPRHCDDRLTILQGDVLDIDADTLRAANDDQQFNVILSDMMAATTGSHFFDHHASVKLARRALTLATDHLLRSGGHLVVKVFEGSEYPAFLQECRACFGRVKGFRPKATRTKSTEMYVIAEGFENSRSH